MKPTIITLAPPRQSTDTIQVATFEQAFGEYSEFFGKRARARRQKRRMERKRNRQERRMTRIRNRAERRKARRDMRTDAMRDRQKRRFERKEMRLKRKSLGKEEEGQEEAPLTTGEEGGGGSDEGQGGGGSDEGQGGGGGYGGGGSDEGQGGGGGYGGGSSDEGQGGGGGYEEEQGGGEEQGGYEEEGGSGEEGGEEGGDSGFDGDFSMVSGAEDYFLSADGKAVEIHPKVKAVAKAIEDLKQQLSLWSKDLATCKNGADKGKYQRLIARTKGRLVQLESMLENYSCARGNKRAEKNRRREIRKARAVARMNKLKSLGKKGVRYIPPVALLRAIKKMRAKKKMNGGSEMPEDDREMNEVPVQSDLDPKFSRNRIEVPAEETTGFNGETGFIGIDQQNDYDAPETRQFNLKFSSADGYEDADGDEFSSADGGKKVNWTAIAIGVGVGALAIYLMNKYKVLDK